MRYCSSLRGTCSGGGEPLQVHVPTLTSPCSPANVSDSCMFEAGRTMGQQWERRGERKEYSFWLIILYLSLMMMIANLVTIKTDVLGLLCAQDNASSNLFHLASFCWDLLVGFFSPAWSTLDHRNFASLSCFWWKNSLYSVELPLFTLLQGRQLLLQAWTAFHFLRHGSTTSPFNPSTSKDPSAFLT